ncbi:hypothetical protein LOK49_LG13G00096 [Camellia lanceoleosa]|uniref:Uncharacterized protein n=1 Tax=Camellia lanceoleosa TaxID=1840588 RepID=A0ACC0FEH9_9ERIC|nr:hypothetical protein LOK49_LG13G00096 [Camellia lanceoleosa]
MWVIGLVLLVLKLKLNLLVVVVAFGGDCGGGWGEESALDMEDKIRGETFVDEQVSSVTTATTSVAKVGWKEFIGKEKGVVRVGLKGVVIELLWNLRTGMGVDAYIRALTTTIVLPITDWFSAYPALTSTLLLCLIIQFQCMLV